GVVASGLIGGGVQEIELVVGKAVAAQAEEEVVEESQRIGMRRVEDVIGPVEACVDERRTIVCLEQPLRMSPCQLRVRGDVERCQPDADLAPLPVHACGERVQSVSEGLVGYRSAPTAPARAP